MKRLGLVLLAACGSKGDPPAPPPPVVPDPAAICAARFDEHYAQLAADLAVIGIRETAAQARGHNANATALAACAHGGSGAPAYVWFDGASARIALFGEIATDRSVAAFAGRFIHAAPAGSLDDTVTWTIAADGGLVIERKPVKGKAITEPPHRLERARARQLAIVTDAPNGTSSRQFVPAFLDGDTLYLSFTSGAMAVAIGTDFALPIDDTRWVVRRAGTCAIVDEHAGTRVPAPCTLAPDRFTVTVDATEQRWRRVADVLVHPAMEAFARAAK